MIKNNFLIFCQLTKRNLKFIGGNFYNILIESAILTGVYTILYKYFFPTLGMSENLSFPLLLGSFLVSTISTSLHKAISFKSDIEFKKIIEYHLILPISKSWLIAEYIISFVLDVIIAMTPTLFLSILFFSDITLFKINWLGFLILYFLIMIFYSLFLLNISLIFDWQWLINNTWDRIINPLMQLGCLLFLWKRLKLFSPKIANILLLNPVTYTTEGLRSSLLGTDNYISFIWCMTVLLSLNILMLITLYHIFNKRLDTV